MPGPKCKVTNPLKYVIPRLQLLPGLVAFEAARRVLGHAVYLERGVLEELSTRETTWQQLLVVYAEQLLDRYQEVVDTDRPEPVLPAVDVVHGVVSHTTLTGRTRLELHPIFGGNFGIERTQPLDLSTGRDLAMALLAMATEPWGFSAPRYWAGAVGHPGEEAVLDAFVALRAAGFGDDEVVAMMAPVGLVPDPDAIRVKVLAWKDEVNLDRKRTLQWYATTVYGYCEERPS